MTSPTLDELLAAALAVPMTPEQAEAQRHSFVYGNVKLSNPDITREMVDEAAERLAREKVTK